MADVEAGVEALPPRSPAPHNQLLSCGSAYEDMALGGVRLTVHDVLPLLQSQYAVIGGRTRDGRPIMIFPAAGAAAGLTDDDFQRLAFYLTSVPSMQEVDAGFVLVVDRRREKWSTVKGVLCQVSGWFPGLIHVVYVLRPASLLQKAISEVSNKFFKEEFKFRVVVCGTVEELHQHLDRSELPTDLGGEMVYSHDTWIQQRIRLERFSSTTREVSAALDEFTARLQAAETEDDQGDNDVEVIGRKLHTQGQQYLELKEGILDAARCGEALLKDVRHQERLSDRACNDNVTSVERLLVQLEETERTFDEFWLQHSARLKQTMELCTFERSFRERRDQLSAHIAVVSEFTLTGESVEAIDALLGQLSGIREVAVADIEQTEEVVCAGQQLVNGRHYVCLDSIRPSCQVLQELCCELTELLDQQTMMLNKYRHLQERIKHANDWCTGGAELVALHAKCPPEKAEQRRQELMTFLANGKDLQASTPEEFHHLDHEKDLTPETRAAVVAVVEKMSQVRALVDKQLSLLKRLSLKVTHRSSLPKPNLPPNSAMDSTLIIGNRRPKSLCESDSSLSPGGDVPRAKVGHILAELLSTEEVYVSELGSIIKGYKHEIENEKYQSMIPPLLHGKSDILFGNLEQIHSFHSEVFLPDLKNCVTATELVAMCFTQNQDKFFQLYSAYCQNIPRSEGLRDSVPEANLFFQACQMKLGHKLPLAAYLLKPVQRITKYQLLLKDLADNNDEKCSPILREALECMLLVLKCVNDSMHQVAITGFWGDLSELGPLLLQGQFSVWTESKKDRLRDLRLKPMQRHIFFYQKSMLFCKKLVNNKATYHFKRSLKTSQIGLTESVKGDPKKFEVWLQGRQEVYTIQASTVEQTKQWVSEIKRVLLEQLRELKGEKIRQYSLVQTSKPSLRGASGKGRSMSFGDSNGSRSASTSTCASEEEAESSEYSVSEDEDAFAERTFDGGRYVSLADYAAIGKSEVSMNEGEEVELLKVGCAGWWFVRVLSSQREGWVPAAFLEQSAKRFAKGT